MGSVVLAVAIPNEEGVSEEQHHLAAAVVYQQPIVQSRLNIRLAEQSKIKTKEEVMAGIKATLANEDNNDCLGQVEFNQILFRTGLPALVGDLVFYLTGKTYVNPGNLGNEEEDAQFTMKNRHAHLIPAGEKEICAGPFFDPEVEGLRNTMKPDDYAQFLSIF